MKHVSKLIFSFLFCCCILTNVAEAQTHPEVAATSAYLKSWASKLSESKSISDHRYNRLITNIDAYAVLYDAYLTKFDAVRAILPNQDEPIGPQEVAKLDAILEANPEVGINNFKFAQKFDELVAFLKIEITPIINDGIVNEKSKRSTIKLADINAESFEKLYEKTKTNLDKYNTLLSKHVESTKAKIANHSERAKGFFRTENYGVEFSNEASSKVFYLKDEIASLTVMNKEVYLALVEQSVIKVTIAKEVEPFKQLFYEDNSFRAESYIALKEVNDATEAKIKIYEDMAKGPWSNFFSLKNFGGQGESVANIMATIFVKDLLMGVVAGVSDGKVALPSFKEKYYLKDTKGNKVNMNWNNFFITMKRHYKNPGTYLNLTSFGITAQAVNILWTQTLFQKLEGLCSRSLFKFGTKLTGGITGFGLSMGIGSYVGSAFGVTWETKSLLFSGDPILQDVAKETFQNELFTGQAIKEQLGSVVISFGFAEAAYAFVNFTVDVFRGKVVVLPKQYKRPALSKLNDKGKAYCEPMDINAWLRTYTNNSLMVKKPKIFSKAGWNSFWSRVFVKGIPVFTAQEIINDFWVSHWAWIENGKKQHEEQRQKTFIKGVDRYLTLFTYDIFRAESPIQLRAIIDKYSGNTYIGYFIDKIKESPKDYNQTLELFTMVRSLFRVIVGTIAADSKLTDAELDAKLKTDQDLTALVYIVQYIFGDMYNVEIEKALLELNNKYGLTSSNKMLTDIGLDKANHGTNNPQDEEKKNLDILQQSSNITDPSKKIAEVVYKIDNKKENFEILIKNAAAGGNISSLIKNQTLSHYLYSLNLMDAKKSSEYAEGLLSRLNEKLPAAGSGSYADCLSALDFIFKTLCPELFGIEHTDVLNALDLSTMQELFRANIFVPLAKNLYSQMKTSKDKKADSDLKALFSDIIKQRDIYGGMSTVEAIAYIYVNAGIPTPPEISIQN